MIIKLLTGTLVMAFAGDVKAFLQSYLSVGDSSVEAELSESGFFYIFSSMSTLNFYVE